MKLSARLCLGIACLEELHEILDLVGRVGRSKVGEWETASWVSTTRRRWRNEKETNGENEAQLTGEPSVT